jgi:putative metalloprotease
VKKPLLLLALALGCAASTQAQFGKLGNIKLNDKAVSAAGKGLKAMTFSSEEAAQLAHEGVEYMDTHNKVAPAGNAYAKRLEKIFGKHKNEDGLKLNYKVYMVSDINAFACADGSVRVFSALMDLMTDEELLAVIGHEIGHVKNNDSRDAVRDAYKRAAFSEAASSQSDAVAKLSDSQLGDFTNALLSSRYSRKQESAADKYSYEFLKRNGYNVMAEASAFRKLAALGDGAKQSNTQKMMSSHPDSEDRAAAVEKWAKKDGLAKD